MLILLASVNGFGTQHIWVKVVSSHFFSGIYIVCTVFDHYTLGFPFCFVGLLEFFFSVSYHY